MEPKINFGNSLFNSNQKIRELTEDNIHLTKRLTDMAKKMEILIKANKSLKNEFNKIKDQSQLESLEFEQTRLNYETLKSKFEEISEEKNFIEKKNENEKMKNVALVKEQEYLLQRNLELDSDSNTKESDLKVNAIVDI